MESQHDQELNIELEALQAIGRALARVQDPTTRRRILHWANERFCAAPEPAVEARDVATQDPALTVDGIELFGETAPIDDVDLSVTVAAAACEASDANGDQSLDSLLRSLGGDIRRLAALWQAA
jgi:hypothetical protein